MATVLETFVSWFGEAIAHAFGDPREEHSFLPPAIGFQPFTGDIHRR